MGSLTKICSHPYAQLSRTISGVRFLLPAGGDARSFPDRIVDFTEVQFRAVFDQASRLCVERGPYAFRPLLTDLGETAAG